VGVATFAAFGSAWLTGTRLEFLLRGELLVVIALPVVPFLIALASWLSSRSREELEAEWNGLRGWQRGGLGLLIVAIAAVIILGGVVLVLDRIAPANR
jgi:hypothetical protein